MRLSYYLKALATAIERASAEHGRPNTFSPRELFEFHGGPSPMITGRIAANPHHMGLVYEYLGGHKKFGSAPLYDKKTKVFAV